MEKDHISCIKQTFIFVSGLILGGMLVTVNSNAGWFEGLVILITGLMFYLGQKISFTPTTKIINK